MTVFMVGLLQVLVVAFNDAMQITILMTPALINAPGCKIIDTSCNQ